MNIYIGSDHGGFNDKEEIKTQLTSLGYNVIDCGAFSLDLNDDYPDFANNLCTKLQQESNKDSKGILLCRSGNGMVIAANKFKGIYASLCVSPEHAIKAREHNNSNVLCLDSDYSKDELHLPIIEAFLKTDFAGMDSRHGRRFSKIKEIEDKHTSTGSV